MSYDTQKHKLNESVQNEANVKNKEDALDYITTNDHPEHVLKMNRIIHLIQNYNFTFGTVNIPFDSRVIILENNSGIEG